MGIPYRTLIIEFPKITAKSQIHFLKASLYSSSPKKGSYAEGRGQKGRHLRMCPMLQGFEAPKFIYEKQRKYVFRLVGARNTASLRSSPEFIYGDT